MKNVYSRLLLAAFALCTITAHSQTVYKLNWSSSFGAWADAQTTGTATNIGGSGVNCTVAMTPSGSAIFTNTGGSPAYNTPTVTNSGMVVAGSSSNIRISMDFSTNTEYMDVVLTFSSDVTGIKFNVTDIDKLNVSSTTYHDKVVVTGSNGTSLYYPVLRKYVVSSDVLGLVAGNAATSNLVNGAGGNSASSAADQNGTVIVDFGTAVLQTITIRYTNGGNTDANPAAQAVAIGNMNFQRTNLPPVSNNFTNTSMRQGMPATSIPALTASDKDGTIASYTITSVPTAAQGVLSVSCPPTFTGATCTGGYQDLTPAVLAANGNSLLLTPAQAAALRFDPAGNFAGAAQFTFTATDNMGAVSNVATYALPVQAQPPVSNNIMSSSLINTAAATAIPALNASDVDGTISTYQLLTLPALAQGVLSVPCPPTFTGATCSGSYQNLTAAILAAYPAGIPLNATQMAAMRFDPDPAFTGKAGFTYNAVDNSSLTSNTATYTIPVSATITNTRPPLADNIVAQALNNSLGSTAIPSLKAVDLDGSVLTYTVLSIPNPAHGVLYCCGGTAITAGQVLTGTQFATLQFDPAATFTGTASFTYSATDNSSLVSNTATYNIPVVNTPPVSGNISFRLDYNAGPTSLSRLSGYDGDGTIASYTITSVPTAAQGVLSVSCPATFTGATCTGGYQDLTPAVLAANSNALVLTPAQAADLRFDPAPGFTGAATFAYTSTDNTSNMSAPAIYTLLVDAQPPVSADVTNATLANSAGATAIADFVSTDADGTIASYLIHTLPPATEGVLSTTCPLNLTGATCTGGFQDLTAAVLLNYPDGLPLTTAQMSALRFDPAAGFTGRSAFTYNALDNSGFESNVAGYYIPVSGTGNIPPVVRNITDAALANTAGPTAIADLLGTDADGTIASYTLTSVPDATQGVLSIPCPATPTGATCTGGFADLTAAVLAANGGNIVLTTVQAAGLRFDPATGFTGQVNFSYVATDNSGAISYPASFTIPVAGIPPVANSITITAISQAAGVTAIAGLSATDVDGTIATYYIESLPAAAEGVISIPCPATLTNATCTGGYQNLTAAVLAAYSGGMPLTPTQAAGMRFDPAGTYTGNLVFNYHAVDNSGMVSNSATYSIPVTGLSPLSTDVVATKMLNSAGPTSISSLVSTDADGTINSYIITGLPLTTQGVLSIPCPATPSGATCTGGFADLTAAVLTANPGGIPITTAQYNALRFDPTAGFIGDAIFNYAAFDNNGNLSNVATFTVPVGSSTTLASTLLNFSGERRGADILLNWKATNETGLNRYEVEWSTDAVNYAAGGSVPARNVATSGYSFTLYNFTAPVYYIRLKSVDASGKETFSGVVVIRLAPVATHILSTAPNPVADKMTIKLAAANAGVANIRIISIIGETVYQQSATMVKGDNLILLTNQLPVASGSYLLQVNLNGEVLSQKFVVNR